MSLEQQGRVGDNRRRLAGPSLPSTFVSHKCFLPPFQDLVLVSFPSLALSRFQPHILRDIRLRSLKFTLSTDVKIHPRRTAPSLNLGAELGTSVSGLPLVAFRPRSLKFTLSTDVKIHSRRIVFKHPSRA
jgi:hypothetical protein